MKVELDEIYKIINTVECSDDYERHGDEWQRGYDEAVAQIRHRVLALDEKEEA